MATNRLLKIVFSLIGLGVATHSVAFNGFGTDIDGYIKDASNRYQVDEAMLRGLVKLKMGGMEMFPQPGQPVWGNLPGYLELACHNR